jgi:DNA-binding NtrC family response regulator
LKRKHSILLVDDNPDDIELVSSVIRPEPGYEIHAVGTGEAARQRLSMHIPDLVLLDLDLPDGMSGLDTLKGIKQLEPTLPVIMVTQSTQTRDAVECIKAGAFHFVEKGNLAVLLSLMQNAIALRLEHRAGAAAQTQIRELQGEIVGGSCAITRMLDEIDRVAKSDAAVLILGESGTGKELAAARIHDQSDRAKGPFMAVDCPALAANLLESEIFGVAANAATGVDAREGRFERAQGGTIFFDEIAEFDISLQPKLLRVLENGRFERVGGKAEIRADARIVSATNRDLEKMTADGSFRLDLLHRVNTVTVIVPPLRERLEDLPLLAEHFVTRFARHRRPEIAKDAMVKLQAYDWHRNNVRELRNCIEAAVIRCPGEELTAECFVLPGSSGAPPPAGGSLEEARSRCEREYLFRLLERCRGNVSRAAKQAEVSRRHLHDLLRKHGLDSREFRDR